MARLLKCLPQLGLGPKVAAARACSFFHVSEFSGAGPPGLRSALESLHLRSHGTHQRSWVARVLGCHFASGGTQFPGSRSHSSMVGPMPAASLSNSESSDDEPSLISERLTAEEYRRSFNMTLSVHDAPAPFQTFEETGFPVEVLRSFARAGYTQPTFIQAQAWPIALQGRDLVAIASTGSGKTAAFLLPAFMHILRQRQLHKAAERQQQGPPGRAGHRFKLPRPSYALVVAPTRELAQQIQHEVIKFGKPLGIDNACLYGGASRGLQGGQLRRGPELIIATPGRLQDFINSGEADLNKVSFLVLDEADRMLDMGFEPQIRSIMEAIPGSSTNTSKGGSSLGDGTSGTSEGAAALQTLFFSATWPREVKAIARQFCTNDPVHLYVGNVQERLVANSDITQHVRLVSGIHQKLEELVEYLDAHSGQSKGIKSSSQQERVVVFCNTKSGCDALMYRLRECGIRAAAVHGDKSQIQRDDAIRALRSGRVAVLVATDVAARGLDIPGVTAVVNYDFPQALEMYIHRIGRTGRAGHKGESLTLIGPGERQFTPGLVQILREAGQEVAPGLAAAAAQHSSSRSSSTHYSGGQRYGQRGYARRPQFGQGRSHGYSGRDKDHQGSGRPISNEGYRGWQERPDVPRRRDGSERRQKYAYAAGGKAESY